MKSYTTMRNLYGKLTRNTTTANLTFGDELINDAYRTLLQKADFPFLHRLRTLTTVAATTFIALPYDVDKVDSVYLTNGSTRYTPKPAPNREFWDKLHYSTYNSDEPEYWFVQDGQIGLWPTPSAGGNTLTINAKVKVRDLNTADITSSTITTLANGSSALTVNAGLTTQMGGFWIRPTFSTTVNTGDGIWYEIDSVTNSTTATLVRLYGGASIAAGTAACTISQMSLLPEAFDNIPVNFAAYKYWSLQNDPRKNEFKDMFISDREELFSAYGFSDLSMVIDDGEDFGLLNPNLTIMI